MIWFQDPGDKGVSTLDRLAQTQLTLTCNSSLANTPISTTACTTSASWNKKPNSAKPPLSNRHTNTTSPKNFVKPFNYVPPKTAAASADQSKSSTVQSGAQQLSRDSKDEEDYDSAVSSMAGSNLDTPPVNSEIYDPPSLAEEPPPLPPKPAFMKGHASPDKQLMPPNMAALLQQEQPTEEQLVIRVDDHVYSEANKAKFQRSLPELNKKKSNFKIKTFEEDLNASCANSKNVSFNPNVKERTRSSSLPRSNSNDDFCDGDNDADYSSSRSHYKHRSSRCSRRSRRHSSSHYHHQYHHHYKQQPQQQHLSHEYCSDPEECSTSERGFNTLPWEYYSESSSSTSSSSDDEEGAPGFIGPIGAGHHFSQSCASSSLGGAHHSQRQRRRHRRSKKSKCKIS